MSQPPIKRSAVDYGDTPEKIASLDEQDRLPDADGSLLRNLAGSKVVGDLTNATIDGGSVNGELTNATIDGGSVNGELTNATIDGGGITGTLTNANIAADQVTGSLDNATINGASVNGTVSSATSASTVPWSGVSSPPTTLTGYNIQTEINWDDAVDVDTLYRHNFLNFEPKVGKDGVESMPVSSTGLTATVGPQDVFISGFWTELPSTNLNLTANATNYIYVQRSSTDIRLLEAFVSTTLFTNTFNKVHVATMTTNGSTVTSTVTPEVNETTVFWDKVRNRPYDPGEIGTYILATRNVAGNIARGATVAGSTLQSTSGIRFDGGDPAGAGMTIVGGLTGTWRCMGTYTHTVNGSLGATLWLRIS